MLVPLSMWILAVALGQSPGPVAADARWLKSLPADVDVAVRISGVEAAHADLMAMLKIMSPTLAERAEPGLTGHLAQFRQKFGEAAARTPWVGLIRTIAPGGEGKPPFCHPGPE